MGAIVSLFFHYLHQNVQKTIEEKYFDETLKLHVKCRNCDPNNENFLYQSNFDAAKGARICVRLIFVNVKKNLIFII
jgi:hypothetical protein